MVQRPRLCRRQLAHLWHPDCFPTELADARCRPRLRSLWRLLRLLADTAFGVNGLGNKILQVMWIGTKYAVTDRLDVMAAYYHYIQNSYFGSAAAGLAPCFGMQHSQCAGTFDGISAAVDWRFAPKWDLYFGLMFTQVNGGLAFGFLQHANVDPTVGVRFRF
jgi:hypothetical protein